MSMKKPDNTMELDAYKRMMAKQEKQKEQKKASHDESLLQRACVAWFRAVYPERELVLFAVPNGGGRRQREAAIMKGEGVTAGVADLILLEARGGYGALCIEMKTTRKESRQRDSQKAWQAAAERAGNKYVIVRTEDEFKEVVAWYMGLPGHGRVFITQEDISWPRCYAIEKKIFCKEQK